MNREQEFTEDMLESYREGAKIMRHPPNRFLQMIQTYGGVETAIRLVTGRMTPGFIELWELERLDITAEALVIKAKYKDLFSAEIREAARRRLRAARNYRLRCEGYDIPGGEEDA